MKTPIVDFVNRYAQSGISRMHMPGHKGRDFLGFEKYDITEIEGADVLSSADGIIAESENNASLLFKTAHSFYSAGGSTLAIYAMISLVCRGNKNPLIIAARNVHKAFIHACALVGCDVEWLMPKNFVNLCSCIISAEDVDNAVKNTDRTPVAVYLTSPDYLGQLQDISSIAAVCKRYGVPLIVDNAHGAYLGFLKESLHPIALGATMCCDSAHKTLPALTGAAYLHISKDAPYKFINNARSELAVFSSTSPSYLILQSLDALNKYLDEDFSDELFECIKRIDKIKTLIIEYGFTILESEPLKIVINAPPSGYTGFELADLLRKGKIEAEYYDRDFIVLMLSPQNSEKDFKRLEKVFSLLPQKKPLPSTEISELHQPTVKMTIRDAVFADSELIDTENALGRICAAPTVLCPPAIPPIISGEEITESEIATLKQFNINKIRVVRL